MRKFVEFIFYINGLLIASRPLQFFCKVFRYLNRAFWGGILKAKATFAEGRILIGTPSRLNIDGDCRIGDEFLAGKGLRLEVMGGTLRIGANVQFEDNCHVGCANAVTIGDGCLLASGVYVADHSHGEIVASDLRPMQRPVVSKGGVTIGRNVWIGEGASVLPGVTLGDGCIVGAGAVVTKSFEAGSVLAGVPARCIRKL